MDGIGYLVDAIVYFLITVGLTSAAVWRVDEKVALPGASPWRIRWPKVFATLGPPLFILACAISFAPSAVWITVLLVLASLAAPWAGAVLITVEWLRRRAEDHRTGLVRPWRPLM